MKGDPSQYTGRCDQCGHEVGPVRELWLVPEGLEPVGHDGEAAGAGVGEPESSSRQSIGEARGTKALEHAAFVCNRCGELSVGTRTRPGRTITGVVAFITGIVIAGGVALSFAFLLGVIVVLLVEAVLVFVLVTVSSLFRPWSCPTHCAACGGEQLQPIWGQAGRRFPCAKCGETRFRYEEIPREQRRR